LKDEAATSLNIPNSIQNNFGSKALLKVKKFTSLFSAGKVSAGFPVVVQARRRAVGQKSTQWYTIFS